MNLGLTEILSTQQVDKPYNKKGGNNADKVNRSNDEPKFKDYIDNNQSRSDASPFATQPKQPNQSAGSVDAEDNNKISFNNKNVSDGDGQEVKENIGSKEKNIQEGLYATLKGLSENHIENLQKEISLGQKGENSPNKLSEGILNNILALQEAEDLQTQITPAGDIMNRLGKAVSSISDEIAQAGLQSTVKENIATSISSIKESIEGISSAEGIISKAQSVSNSNVTNIGDLANLDISLMQPETIKEIAGNVIQSAKENANSLDVLKSDVKSGQLESLLGLNNEEGKKQNKLNENNNLPLNKADAQNSEPFKGDIKSDLSNLEVLTQKLQKQADNQTTQNSKAVQIQNAINNSGTQNNASSGDSGSFKNGGEFAQNMLQSSVDSPPATNTEFTKFQKYIDTASNNIKNMGAGKAAKADDVLAQIKFGTSSMGKKGDSKITIQLHPKELGSVDVRMEVGNDGKTKVAIMAEKIDTLNLLQKESGSLKGLLQDALQTQSSDLNFSFHEQSDEKWKEIIQEAFGSNKAGLNEEEEADYSKLSNSYGQNMTAVDGLDISV